MNELNKFGNLVTRDLRDRALNKYLSYETSSVSGEQADVLNNELADFTEKQKRTVRKLITECLTTGIHDFLFAIDEEKDEVQIFVAGQNIAEMSDGLHGEIFTEDGWFEKYSEHKESGLD